ncbi:MAG: hypothetical protein M3Y64_11455, partial [Gemmatimonadota bacterium]|nr:hypothetical protein [Gemmatimonadota bacterium]
TGCSCVAATGATPVPAAAADSPARDASALLRSQAVQRSKGANSATRKQFMCTGVASASWSIVSF